MSKEQTPQRKHFAEFYSPGTILAEVSTVELECDSIEEAVYRSKSIVVRHGATPYAFDIVTKIVAPPVDGGEDGVMMDVIPKEVERRGRFYLGGKLRRFGEVVKAEGENAVIVFNMRSHECPICIEIVNGYRSTHFFDENDVIVNPNTGDIIRRGNDPDLVGYRSMKLKEWKGES